jgi:DNA polymerase-3 subunit epsilon
MLHNLTIFDFETSGRPGVDAGEMRVFEMAAVKVMNGEIVSQFQTIVHQPIAVPEKITELTGITQAEVDAGMPEKLAFAMLNNLSAGTTLAAHNALFDWWFYEEALQRIGGRSLTADLLCSCTMSREVLGGKGHKLIQLMERLDLKFTGAHRALNDVMGTFQLLKHIDGQCNMADHVNRLGFKKWFGRPAYVPAHCHVYGQS